MSNSTCSIEGCERPRRARGWCMWHYDRNRRFGDPTAKSHRDPNNTLEDFLELYTPKDLPADVCWDWTGSCDDKGYGRFKLRGAFNFAHRASYTVHVGPIADGLFIRHDCDRPVCVNPAHLQPGTQAQNVEDSILRGRHTRGTTQGLSKVTEDDVLEIRRLHAEGGWSYPALGQKFGLTGTSIGYIVRRHTWKHI